MATRKVGYLVGSLAKGSINRKLALALVHAAPPGLALTEIPIRDLPLYSYDFDADFPAPARAFKEALAASDALLFVTRSTTAASRAGSRTPSTGAAGRRRQNSFAHKPSAVIGASPGRIGTAVAQRELHSVLGAVASPQMVSPEAYIQFTPDLIDGEGKVADASTRAFLEKFMAAFQKFLDRQLA